MDFWKDGYIILRNVFSSQEINEYRELIHKFVKENKTLKNAGGITIPNFIKHSELSEVKGLMENEKIHKELERIFGGNDYRFCQHNDIGINRIVGWHKDKLNGKYASHETVDIWSEINGEKHEIVKVLIYLQDHRDNNDGLKLVPGSHLVRNMQTKGTIQLRPELGDVVIFDQRITHRGMDHQVKDSRILVAFGFGKNNIFTDNFEKGTVKRQNDQNS